jgi:hypothetical protein
MDNSTNGKLENPNMPRGGSKKGEHRGEIKREAKSAGIPGPKRKRGNPIGRVPGTMTRRTKNRLRLISKELGLAELSGMMPKDMLLAVSRIFFKMAMDDQKAIATASEPKPVDNQQVLTPEEENPDGRDELELVGAFERHLVLAADTAYKAANFYHPRLEAIAVAGNSDQSPGDVLRGLLAEIDGDSRKEREQIKQIEHEPTPEAVALKDVMEG